MVKSLNVTLHSCFLSKDGAVEPQVPHPAVPIKDVVLLKSLMDDGLSFTSALRLLRRSHFPFNYDPHPWKPGML